MTTKTHQYPHHLTEHLAQGKGQEGAGEPAYSPEGHVQAFKRLRTQHRRWGKKTKQATPAVDRGRGAQLSRYLAASKDFFGRRSSLTVALDASRVGGKDLLLAAVLGCTGTETKCAWAPPQFIAFFCGTLNSNALEPVWCTRTPLQGVERT